MQYWDDFEAKKLLGSSGVQEFRSSGVQKLKVRTEESVWENLSNQDPGIRNPSLQALGASRNVGQSKARGKKSQNPHPRKPRGCGTQIRHRASRVRHATTRLAFIDDLNIVAVRIKHPGGIIARIVFGTGLRRFLTLSSSC